MATLPQPGRTVVMGIVNVTPDSFSDGGRYLATSAAVEHGLALLAQGADVIDVGGESTRPGADRVPVAEELARVVPVIAELAVAGAVVSVDTTRAQVAAAAVDAGASIVNDVSGGLADEEMLATVVELEACYVAMHWRGHSAGMDDLARYHDVVAEVAAELAGRRDAALGAGLPPGRLVLDPGLGFAKTAAHNWRLLARLDVLAGLGAPLLVGASRKRFLGEALAVGGTPRPPSGRDDATAALTAILATGGVWGVRTHTVAAHLDAAVVAARLRAERTGASASSAPGVVG